MAPEIKQFGRTTLASLLGSAISLGGFIFWAGSFTATTKTTLADHEKRITVVETAMPGLVSTQNQFVQWQRDHAPHRKEEQ